MKAKFARNLFSFARCINAGLVAIGLSASLACSPIQAQSPVNLPYKRLVTEVRELKRLVFQLKKDEAAARLERDSLTKRRANASRFANGGQHPQYGFGFVSLVQSFEQSPQQASLLQLEVSAIPANQFVPRAKRSFPGGSVAQLLQFCQSKGLGVRYGGRAQLVVAELARDVLHQADTRIAELDERIEVLKAQNVAHTDILGKLILAEAHCHHRHGCYHHGYGYCGYAVPAVIDYPPAGLASRAYDVSPLREFPSRVTSIAKTDGSRLRFLQPDTESAEPQSPDTGIAAAQMSR